MLCIINGRIIDPEQNKVYPGDVWIEDGIIRKIAVREEGKGADAGELPEGAEVLNAEGMMLGPGLIDTHVHFRDPGFTYKEDILSGGPMPLRRTGSGPLMRG